MNRNLNDVKWKEFNIIEILGKAHNSKAYHNNNLIPDKYGIPYITRTNFNNGLYDTVKNINNLIVNPSNTITLGAENATYFTQPFNYITGNKMYYYQSKGLSLKALKFITICLNKSLVGGGFGYGLGLTGTRSDKRKFMLPVNSKGEPDYKFMEEYIKERENKFEEQYKEHTKKLVANLKKRIDKKVNWNNFPIADIFNIKSGKRLTKADMKIGNVPFISAADNNNGVTNFISNLNESLDKNVLGVNYDGNGGMVISFYHPYDCIFSDSVKRFHFKNTQDDKYVFLFTKVSILKQRDKYRYGYKFNETRMKKQQIMLPVDSKGEPDYDFMHNYMLYLEQKKILEYLEYINE